MVFLLRYNVLEILNNRCRSFMKVERTSSRLLRSAFAKAVASDMPPLSPRPCHVQAQKDSLTARPNSSALLIAPPVTFGLSARASNPVN